MPRVQHTSYFYSLGGMYEILYSGTQELIKSAMFKIDK